MNTRDALTEAKQRLPLPLLWRKLNWQGEPAQLCNGPYRENDSRKSGSVFIPADGDMEIFHDFKTGETLDAITLLARMEGLENGEACRRFMELAGVCKETHERSKPKPPATVRMVKKQVRCKPVLPPLNLPTLADCEAIAACRGLLPRAVLNAAADGMLFVCEQWRGARCWALTDASRWNAFFRRMDGEPFTLADGTTAKTLGIKGGFVSWPVGLPLATEHDFKCLAMVEGAPDALAAYQILCESRALITDGASKAAGVLSMASAALSIPDECLPFFAGRRVRIFADVDDKNQGHIAAARWERQLEEAGAGVDSFDLRGLFQADGKPVEDLNDACRMTASERAALGLWEGMNE